MKKITAILILLLLTISHLGYWAVFSYKQYQARKEAQYQLLQTLPDNRFEIIILEDHKQAIIWEEEGKEFYLQGELYDVAKSKIIDGKTFLYCLNDKKEKDIVVKQSFVLKSQLENNGDKKAAKIVLGIQINDFCTNFYDVIPTIFFEQSTKKYFSFDSNLSSGIMQVNASPPRS